MSALFSLLSGCGGAPTPATAVAPTKPPEIAPPVTPATWFFAPSKARHLLARRELASGVVFLGAEGERYLEKSPADPIVVADTLLPEGSVDHLDESSKTYFAGAQSALYLTDGLLGSVLETRPYPGPAIRAAFGRNASGVSEFFVLLADGELYTSKDLGKTFSKITPKTSGRLTELAVSRRGDVVVAGVPQQVWALGRDGLTFSQVSSPGVGLTKLLVETDEIFLVGVFGGAVFRSGGAPSFEAVARLPSGRLELPELEVPVDFGNLRAHPTPTAAVAFNTYFQLLKGESALRLLALPLGSRPGESLAARFANPRTYTLTLPEKCPVPSFAISQGGLAVGCHTPSKGVSFFVNRDAETLRQLGYREKIDLTFEKVGTALRGRVLSVAPDGALLVADACKGSAKGCVTVPGLILSKGEKAFARMATPAIVSTIDEIAMLPTGEALAIGLAKGRAVTLHSSNGGRDFAMLDLWAASEATRGTAGVRRVSPLRHSLSKSATRLSVVGRVGVDELVFTFESLGDRVGATVRATAPTEASEPLSLVGKLLPSGFAAAMAGERGLAMDRMGHLRETLDGGSTWLALASKQPAFAPDSLKCGEWGCTFGADGIRLGWGEKNPARLGDPGLASKAEPPKTTLPTRLLTCDGEATALGSTGVAQPPSIGAAYPGRDLLARFLRQDAKTGASSVVEVEEKTTRELTLFGATGRDQTVDLRPQLEGTLAVRVSFSRLPPPPTPVIAKPPASPAGKFPPAPIPLHLLIPKAATPVLGAADTKKPVDVDLAMYLSETGKIIRMTKRAVTGFRSVESPTFRADFASIAEGGAHFRHGDGPYLFFKSAGGVEEVEVPRFRVHDVFGDELDFSDDALRLGGKTHFLRFFENHVTWASPGAAGYDYRTWSLGSAHAGHQISLEYDRGRPVLVSRYDERTAPGAPMLSGAVVETLPGVDPKVARRLPAMKHTEIPFCVRKHDTLHWMVGASGQLTAKVGGIVLTSGSLALQEEDGEPCIESAKLDNGETSVLLMLRRGAQFALLFERKGPDARVTRYKCD